MASLQLKTGRTLLIRWQMIDKALEYLEGCGEQLAWSILSNVNIDKVHQAADELREVVKLYQGFKEIYPQLVCAITHNIDTCDSCQKCGDAARIDLYRKLVLLNEQVSSIENEN